MKALDALYNVLADAGNAPLRWAPPNGFPDVAAAWTSPSAFLLRCNMHLNLAAGWYPRQLTRPADLLTVTRSRAAGHLRRPGRRARPAADRRAAAGRAGRRGAQRRGQAADQSVDRRRQPQSPDTLPYLIALVLDSPSFQLR